MTERFEISRRKALAALGTIGVAAGGAGVGTSAYFNDTESFENNIVTAGTLDLIVDYYSYWNQGSAGSGYVTGSADGEAVTAELSDVKPGDNGLIAFCPRIETNPAYLWLCGALTANDENGRNEPEKEVDETTGAGNGELAQNIDVTLRYCEVADDFGSDFTPEDVTNVATAWTGTLAEFLATIQYGVPLDGDATVPSDGSFPAPGEQAHFVGSDSEDENYCLCLDWEVPTDVGNEIQSDLLKFDLEFHAQQYRHNDGTNNPCAISTETGDDFVKVARAFNEDETISGGARARYGNNGSSGAWELAVGDEPGTSGEFVQGNYVWTSGQAVDWSVAYDASSDELSFTFDGNTISDTLDDQPDGRMGIQGKADEATVDASIDSLSIDGSPAPLSGPTSITATNDGSGREIKHLLVNTAFDGSTSFEVSGKATVTLQGDYPGGGEDVSFDVVFE
jgi:predicted ribosomally synthesized peptide with SipW-like signal peptide